LHLQSARERGEFIASIDPNRVRHVATTCTIWIEV
jgi:hypothetical protein